MQQIALLTGFAAGSSVLQRRLPRKNSYNIFKVLIIPGRKKISKNCRLLQLSGDKTKHKDVLARDLKLQNHVARVVTKSSYDTNSCSLLNSISWKLLISEKGETKGKFTYRCVNKLAIVDLCNMFTLRTLSFDLRDARQKLYLPKLRNDYLKRSFSYSGACLYGTIF